MNSWMAGAAGDDVGLREPGGTRVSQSPAPDPVVDYFNKAALLVGLGLIPCCLALS